MTSPLKSSTTSFPARRHPQSVRLGPQKRPASCARSWAEGGSLPHGSASGFVYLCFSGSAGLQCSRDSGVPKNVSRQVDQPKPRRRELCHADVAGMGTKEEFLPLLFDSETLRESWSAKPHEMCKCLAVGREEQVRGPGMAYTNNEGLCRAGFLGARTCVEMASRCSLWDLVRRRFLRSPAMGL